MLGLINNALAHVWDGVSEEQCSGLFMLAEDYLTTHHKNEEELFASLQEDTEYSSHIAEHHEFADSLRRMRDVYERCDGKRTLDLVRFFTDEFERHIANDVKFLRKLVSRT